LTKIVLTEINLHYIPQKGSACMDETFIFGFRYKTDKIRIHFTMTAHRYFIVNKPYNMLSQFVSEKEAALLGDLDFDFPTGTHAVGRLDKQSEGLLILTTNKKVTRLLFQGAQPHSRTYLVRVKNVVTGTTLQQIRTGIDIRIKGGDQYITTPCKADIIEEPVNLFPHGHPVPAYPPYTWLQLTLTEGKYHQIRKMTGAVHHRCQRLVRIAIEDLQLAGLAPGAVKEIEEADFFRLLKIDHWQVKENGE
jgi:23S rRNA pseudouridine2457 synthase